jgi:rhodanese-related sulfurtransferase
LTNDQFFTRADWRPGKRHTRQLRTKPWGGAKVANAAFLEASKRMQFKPGRPGYLVCSAVKRNGEPCGMLAMRGLTVCGAHGGFGIWAKRGKLKRSGKKQALQAERVATIEGRSFTAPQALARLLIYQQSDQRMRMKLAAVYQTPSWPVLVKHLRGIEHCV